MASFRKSDDFTSELGSEAIEEQIFEDAEVEVHENPYIQQFYDAIPEISKLAKTLISPKPMRRKDLRNVLWRCPEGSMTAQGVLTSHRAKKFRTEINAGCGFDSPANKPYRPFESGIGFEESATATKGKLKSILNGPRKSTSRRNTGETQEISLDQEVKAKVARYSRKFFSLNLEKYPRAQVKGKSIVVTVESVFGDPDLYMSIAEPPTEREYVWRSLLEGSDKIEIHPDDPNYIIGTYYIAVYCSASDCEFFIQARACRPIEHDDADRFTRAQFSMYDSIRASIRQSGQRLKLCAGGKSWHQQLLRDAEALQPPPPAAASDTFAASDSDGTTSLSVPGPGDSAPGDSKSGPSPSPGLSGSTGSRSPGPRAGIMIGKTKPRRRPSRPPRLPVASLRSKSTGSH